MTTSKVAHLVLLFTHFNQSCQQAGAEKLQAVSTLQDQNLGQYKLTPTGIEEVSAFTQVPSKEAGISFYLYSSLASCPTPGVPVPPFYYPDSLHHMK
ncbi:hypothetical protein Y1Q_0008786 [Alligator mississippiensis]|uniref:Uncharacterized protein n=1 Tax=Alligator mississippiensis TaxID=8496 RepID=A0A151NA30_ALLMI|nr:hypothetical protein Y1Q_0008786 [Alligator mississippiensis]